MNDPPWRRMKKQSVSSEVLVSLLTDCFSPDNYRERFACSLHNDVSN